MREAYDVYCSTIGDIYVVVDEIGVRRVELFEKDWLNYKEKNPALEQDKEKCAHVVEQLHEYFIGKRKNFTLPLSIEGTAFRRRVWDVLQTIPYGEIRSYLDVAAEIGNPKAARAVGQANKSNNLPILIPCHRVMGKNDKLVGYAGNRTHVQEFLLILEGVKVRKCKESTYR